MTLHLFIKIISVPILIFCAIFVPLALLVGFNDLIEEWKWKHKNEVRPPKRAGGSALRRKASVEGNEIGFTHEKPPKSRLDYNQKVTSG